MAKSKINPNLAKGREVEIKTLKQDPDNARIHNTRNLGSIKTSLESFGQQKAIVILEDGKIIAGNGTVQAMIELGWDTVFATVFDSDKENDAIAYAIADNKTAELAEWDFEMLAKNFDKIKVDTDLLKTGFDEQETQTILMGDWTSAPKKFDPASVDLGMGGEPEKKCPQCGYVFP
jgi:ParB-like chromosome segregation protein Spo0J